MDIFTPAYASCALPPKTGGRRRTYRKRRSARRATRRR
jgi:hypothetical protein